jgi:hypothetical protein
MDWAPVLWGSWPRRLYVLLIVTYAVILAPVALYSSRTLENLTQFAAVSTCVVTVFVGVWRADDIQRLWSKLGWSASKKLLLAGGLGAVYVETEYEVWQNVFGASGVAANPNLVIDLLETMPWYLMMVGFLTVALRHRRATLFQLLLLGGVYELMADGILGSILAAKPAIDFLGLPFAVPIFTLVYSPIVALPALAVWPSYQRLWSTNPPNGSRLWLFFPCLPIIPYGVFLILLLFAL